MTAWMRQIRTKASLLENALTVFYFILFLIFFGNVAVADTRQVIDYTYDSAGNIIGVQSDITGQAPAIASISPSQIRIGRATSVTVLGAGLNNPTVSIDHSGITTQITRSTNNQVDLIVEADDSVAIASYTLSLSTALGTDSAQIEVRPLLPVIELVPSPIVIDDSGQSRLLELAIATPDLIDHTLTLSVADPQVASVTPAVVTIPAGAIKPIETIMVVGNALGNTALTINAAQLETRRSNIFVTSSFIAPAGQNGVYAKPLGLVVESSPTPPDLISLTPFYNTLSIVKEGADEITNTTQNIFSSALRVVFGTYFSSVTPSNLVRGSGSVVVQVSGQGLADVSNIEILPNDGITVSNISPSVDGLALSFTVEVEQDTVIGLRHLRLFNALGAIPASSIDVDRVFISDDLPEVVALSPIVLTRLQTATMTVYGENLQNTQSVTLSPSQGVDLGSFTVNSDGTELTIGVVVAELAPLGPRTVTVTTGSGASETNRTEKNTLTILNGPVDTFESISAPGIGVVLSDAQVNSMPLSLYAQPVKISFGSVFEGLSPASQVIGTTETLTISGQGLLDVNGIEFIPADGITTNNLIVAGDGQSLTVDVSVASDAPQTLRQVNLLTTTSTRISPVSNDSNRFLITAPQPDIFALVPNVLLKSSGTQSLVVTGENFSSTSEVVITPVDDLSVSSPVVSSDGRSLSVNISVANAAVVGQRLVQIRTEAGETTMTLSAANTLRLAEDVLASYNHFVAPALGVVVSETPVPQPVDRSVTSPALNIVFEDAPPPPVMKSILTRAAEMKVSLGNYIESISPNFLVIDTTSDIVINGQGLDNVTAVNIVPSEGLTQGAFTVSPDGTQLTLPLTASADAAQILRQIQLETNTGQIYANSPRDSGLLVTNQAPTIDSIDPIQEVIGNTFTMMIRGTNLRDVVTVEATPSNGITFGSTPTVNTAGTELTIQVTISPSAAAGARVITVTTLSGATSSIAVPANTFNVLNE